MISNKEKILFIMFQGGGSNLKSWNEYTESKFLDRLKKIGKVYVYQDKIYNTFYYNKNNPLRKDYDSNLDFDLNYNNLDKHIKYVYDDIIIKYKNIDKYKFIPIGWSAGGYLALYFSQIYYKKCKSCVLLDPALITPNNINLRIESFKKDKCDRVYYPITNNKYKKLLLQLKENKDDTWKIIITTSNYIRTLFIKDKLNIKFNNVPVISFYYINKPYVNEFGDEFNNKTKKEEIKILSKINKNNYKPHILINSGHCVFNKIDNANFIISKINDIIIK
jgi:hypothetical protein